MPDCPSRVLTDSSSALDTSQTGGRFRHACVKGTRDDAACRHLCMRQWQIRGPRMPNPRHMIADAQKNPCEGARVSAETFLGRATVPMTSGSMLGLQHRYSLGPQGGTGIGHGQMEKVKMLRPG